MYGVHCVNLVANKHNGDLSRVVAGCLDEDLPPLLQVLVRLGRRDVKDQDAPVAPSVKGSAQTLKALLAGCVPKLQININPTLVESQFLFGKFRSDSRLRRLGDLLVIEGLNEGTFPDSGVSNDYDLEEAFLRAALRILRHY